MEQLRMQMESAVSKFVSWLDQYGETSYDFQTFYAGTLGRKAKALDYRRPRLGTLAVSPIIFCEAFAPAARRFFHVPQRFPIADAHYAMGFALRFRLTGNENDYRRAVHFLEVLLKTRCQGYTGYSWGYPFDWETVGGTVKQGTPLITSLPYVYEAFSHVYQIDRQERWLEAMRLIAEHALHDYQDFETAPGAATCAYGPSPKDRGGVVNASAYRAFLLTKAAIDLKDPRYKSPADRNLRFVIDCQQPDGSWLVLRACQGSVHRSFPHLFCAQGTGEDRPAGSDSSVQSGPRARCAVLCFKSFRRGRAAEAVFETAETHCLSTGALRLCGVREPDGVAPRPIPRT